MMQETANEMFISLFKEAFAKCFGAELHTSLSETECKHFSNRVLEETGLVIGAKSLKNYSLYALNPETSKPEKPSVATLDTLARYVLNAPYTDEITRKEKQPHYPYWFQYRNSKAVKSSTHDVTGINIKNEKVKVSTKVIIVIAAVTAVIICAVAYFLPKTKNASFEDNFHNLNADSLAANGWMLQSEDTTWWKKRSETPSHLTLFTLKGDNWTDSLHKPVIKNLLIRKLPADCFTTEIHLDNFVPLHRWQQAGILLLEDTNFSGRSLRLSLAFNDFFGGFNRPKEIIIQAITSNKNNANNPEEFIHLPVFTFEQGQDSLVISNLQNSALRIEKNGIHFRFLYATGQAENFAFKEALNKDLSFDPKYVGIFALQGFVEGSNNLPARFKYFSIDNCVQ